MKLIKLFFILSIFNVNLALSQIELIKNLNENESGFYYGSRGSYYLFNDNLLFTNSLTRELFTTVNTNEDIIILTDSSSFPIKYPYDFFKYNDLVYFTGLISGLGYTFYVSDGTSKGTYKISDIFFTSIFGITQDSSKIYFTGKIEGKYNFYVFDLDSYFLTKIVDDNNYDFVFPFNYIKYNNHIYFIDQVNNISSKLWRYNQNSGLVEKINNGWLSAEILTTFKNNLILRTKTTAYGNEIFIGDGTPTGTKLLKNVNSGSNDSSPTLLFQTDEKLYFSMDDGIHGIELWISDGTGEGTVLYGDFNPGLESGYPTNMFSLKDELFLLLRKPDIGRELHKIKNNEIVLVSDIDNSPSTSGLSNIIKFKDFIYFNADDGIHGEELWISDGTYDGTNMIEDFDTIDTPKPTSTISPLAGTDSGLFIAMDKNDIGWELYFLPFIPNSVENEYINSKYFNIFPNPTNGSFNFNHELEFTYGLLIDYNGILIEKFINENKLKSKINECNPGIYYIILYDTKKDKIFRTSILKY